MIQTYTDLSGRVKNAAKIIGMNCKSDKKYSAVVTKNTDRLGDLTYVKFKLNVGNFFTPIL